MIYKTLRIVILDEKNVIAIPPDRPPQTGKVEMDLQKKKILRIFHSMLETNRIINREELEVFGSLLYEVLFKGDIHTAFEKTYNDIQEQPDTCLRVVLEFKQEAQFLATLPWEFLYYQGSGHSFHVATKNKLILTRHVPLIDAFSKLQPNEKPLRILVVVSQPDDLGEVIADPVIEAIQNLRSKLPEAVEIDSLPQPNEGNFPQKMKDLNPHVLHFIGHGKWDSAQKNGQLAFVNRYDNSAMWITDKDLSDYFLDYKPRLIFLHACKGASSEEYEGFRGVALQLVYSLVPAVVAMQYPIENKPAIQFAQKFYECLGEGKPIDVAVQEGRQELAMYLKKEHFSSRDFGSPVVYLQSAEGIIIAEAEKPKISEGILQKVPCPYPTCLGFVIPGNKICTACNKPLTKCPKCGAVMAEEVGICGQCTWKPKVAAQITAPRLTTDEAVKKQVSPSSFKTKSPQDQGGQ